MPDPTTPRPTTLAEDVLARHRKDPRYSAPVYAETCFVDGHDWPCESYRLARIVEAAETYVSEYEQAFAQYPLDPQDEPELHREIIGHLRAILAGGETT